MDVLVIGGGPAGMMAAITSAECGNKVTILEKMNTCGKKLLITGKGRCNITNSAEISDFMKYIPGNSKFLYSAFSSFSNLDIVNLLQKQGVATKVERGGRIFPVSDRAQDVLNAFLSRLRELNVKIINNCKVSNIIVKDNKVTGVKTEDNREYKAQKVILATGGITYPLTGSTGDGYTMAEKLGHSIESIRPALVPLNCFNDSLKICKESQGLSLKNIAIKVLADSKVIYEDFGEMLFTHFGISGPVILSSSSMLLRHKNVTELFKYGKIKLQIDLKPALNKEKLDLRVRRDFEEAKNKQYKNSLDKLLPQKLILPFIEYTQIDPQKQVNAITKEERANIVDCLKCMELTIGGFANKQDGIITAGGVSTKEINPKTMESKIINGLYFAGEVIDVDALTGGFNLQIAYSTGYTAGKE